MVTLQTVIASLDKLFGIFNDHYFNGNLIKPVILVQTNGHHRLALGWCTTKKIWKNTLSGDFYYEITLCAEFLYRGVSEICETLLHEMAHLSNLQKEIQDCSRGGSYHNKRFKSEAEQCGLIVSFNQRYGWAFTRLNEESAQFIADLQLNPATFALTREAPSGNAPPKSKSRKYVCPLCQMIVRATREVNIICGDCNETMFEVPT